MELKSQYAFTLHIKVADPIDFGSTYSGDRRFVPITGGYFEGPRLKGEILPGGGDWSTARSDGVVHLNAKYSMRTHDGTTIAITNEGFGRGTQEQMKAAFEGNVPSTPEAAEMAKKHWYTKSWPRFEVEQGPYDWVNKACFVGDMAFPTARDVVVIKVYELL